MNASTCSRPMNRTSSAGTSLTTDTANTAGWFPHRRADSRTADLACSATALSLTNSRFLGQQTSRNNLSPISRAMSRNHGGGT